MPEVKNSFDEKIDTLLEIMRKFQNDIFQFKQKLTKIREWQS